MRSLLSSSSVQCQSPGSGISSFAGSEPRWRIPHDGAGSAYYDTKSDVSRTIFLFIFSPNTGCRFARGLSRQVCPVRVIRSGVVRSMDHSSDHSSKTSLPSNLPLRLPEFAHALVRPNCVHSSSNGLKKVRELIGGTSDTIRLHVLRPAIFWVRCRHRRTIGQSQAADCEFPSDQECSPYKRTWPTGRTIRRRGVSLAQMGALR